MEPNRRVALAIGAHADDIELGCGGTLIRLKREEHFRIYGFILTASGAKTEPDPTKTKRTTEVRRNDAKSSARFLDFDKYVDPLLFTIERGQQDHQTHLDNLTISEELRRDFAHNQISLSPTATVTVEHEGNSWLIVQGEKENERNYRVKIEADGLYVYDHCRLWDDVLFFGGLIDGDVRDNKETVREILEIVDRVKPTLVFSHTIHDGHNDHRHAAESMLSVREKAVVLHYEIHVSDRASFKPNVCADISESIDGKLSALEHFETEIPNTFTLDGVKKRAKMRGSRIAVRFAECFEIDEFHAVATIPSAASRVLVPYPRVPVRFKRWLTRSLLLSFGILFLLLLAAWWQSRPSQEEMAIEEFWRPFLKDGAVLVIAEAPLVFTGPDASHELPVGSVRYRVLPPTGPAGSDIFRKGDFKTLGEVLENAGSEEQKERIRQHYATEHPEVKPGDVVPYFVVRTPGYTGTGDARAVAEVFATLLHFDRTLVLPAGKAPPKLRVETADFVREKLHGEYSDQNLIIFGGAGANVVTKQLDQLMDKISPGKRFRHGSRFDSGDLDGAGRKIGVYSQEDRKDCGSMVYLPPNFLGQRNRHGHVVIFDGYETAATLATARVTTRPELEVVMQINEKLDRQHAIQLEVQVDHVTDSREPAPGSIRLVKFMRFATGNLSKDGTD